jgi:hypothetical protein
MSNLLISNGRLLFPQLQICLSSYSFPKLRTNTCIVTVKDSKQRHENVKRDTRRKTPNYSRPGNVG